MGWIQGKEMKYHIKRKKKIVSNWEGTKKVTPLNQSYCNRHKSNYIEDAYRRTDGRYVLTVSSICTICKNRFIMESFNIKS